MKTITVEITDHIYKHLMEGATVGICKEYIINPPYNYNIANSARTVDHKGMSGDKVLKQYDSWDEVGYQEIGNKFRVGKDEIEVVKGYMCRECALYTCDREVCYNAMCDTDERNESIIFKKTN